VALLKEGRTRRVGRLAKGLERLSADDRLVLERAAALLEQVVSVPLG
jgi:hypothetical protein